MGKRSVGKSRFLLAKLALLIAAFTAMLLLSLKFDNSIVKFASELQNPLLDKFMLVVTYAGSVIVVLFVLTSLFLLHEHKRKWLFPLWMSLLSSFAVVAALKLVFIRVRPYYIGFPTLKVLVQTQGLLASSFPSLHAAVAFAALPILDREFPRLKFFWLVFACLVGFSRVYFSLHYMSDVLAGAFLGYFIGLAAVRLEERYGYTNNFFVVKKNF